MSEQSPNSRADKYREAMSAFRALAGEEAPTPGHPAVIVRLYEIWDQNRRNISKEDSTNPATWKDAVISDTVSMLNRDGVLDEERIPDMDREAVERALETYFNIH